METILDCNPALAARVLPGSRQSQDSSDASTIRSAFTSVQRTVRTAPSLISVRGSSLFPFAFEQVLNQTRVYRRAFKNVSTHSFKSLATKESNWSQLTRLSLSQISCIAVIFLPVYIDELFNKTPYMETLPEDRSLVDNGKSVTGPPPLEALRPFFSQLDGHPKVSIPSDSQGPPPVSPSGPSDSPVLGLGLVGMTAPMSPIIPASFAMPVDLELKASSSPGDSSLGHLGQQRKSFR